MLFQVTAFVLDGIRMIKKSEEANFLNDVLPFVHGLFARIGHLLDGDHLLGLLIPGKVHSSEASMANLS